MTDQPVHPAPAVFPPDVSGPVFEAHEGGKLESVPDQAVA